MAELYLIGNAHIDPVWLWTKAEGLAEIKATFRSALDRMKEFDDYVFTSACAGYYQWIEKNEPKLFEEIRERVIEGRWAIAGGMWVQPDCNIPCGESFARHFLYSQRYFKEHFGKYATVGYNVDSFGHNGMLPQLLKKSGIDNYVFMRPDSVREKPSLQENLFMWESPDGSQVLTYRIPIDYKSMEMPDLEAHKRLSERDGIPYMVSYGVGNHGGGPTIKMLQELEKLVSDDIQYADPEQYFEEINKRDISSLRVLKEDLQHHASGCYAASATLKQKNRQAESALICAEKFDVMSGVLLPDTLSHQNDITRAWEKVMFNQFHDILAGCSIRSACEAAGRAFDAAVDVAEEIKNFALQRISWNIDTTRNISGAPVQRNGFLWEKDGEGAPFVVFNPHSFPVRRVVQYNSGSSGLAGVCDQNGTPVAIQGVRGQQTNEWDKYNHIFMADLPAYGYQTYYLYRQESFDTSLEHTVSAKDNVLENRFLRVEFDPVSGCVERLIDKRTGKTINKGPFGKAIVIDDEKTDTWSHGVFEFSDKVGEFGDASLQVLYEGPIKATMRVFTRYQNSVLQQDFTLYPDSTEIEVARKLRFLEQFKLVKLAFAIEVEHPIATYAIPFGYIHKETNGLEEPAQCWADVHDDERGLAIISDSKYSYSVQDNELRMVIARGCLFADHYGHRDGLEEFQDQGDMYFSYTIYPHGVFEEGVPSEIAKRAALLQNDLCHITETHHEGTLKASGSFMDVSVDNVIVETVKRSENQKGFIVRVYEADGISTEAVLTFFGQKITLKFAPQEVKTILFSEKGEPLEVNLLEEA